MSPGAHAADELVAPFRLAYTYTRSLGPVLSRWLTALRDARVEGVVARDGRVLCPPSDHDPLTGEPVTGRFVDVGPEGVVTAWTWVAEPRPQHPSTEPFAFALVRLDGADTALLHVVLAPSEASLRTGLRVRAVWATERVGHPRDLRGFVPVEAA